MSVCTMTAITAGTDAVATASVVHSYDAVGSRPVAWCSIPVDTSTPMGVPAQLPDAVGVDAGATSDLEACPVPAPSSSASDRSMPNRSTKPSTPRERCVTRKSFSSPSGDLVVRSGRRNHPERRLRHRAVSLVQLSTLRSATPNTDPKPAHFHAQNHTVLSPSPAASRPKSHTA